MSIIQQNDEYDSILKSLSGGNLKSRLQTLLQNKAIDLDPNYASAYKNRGIVKQSAGINPCSDWKKACDLGKKECCMWYIQDNCELES